jgi:hypothetical protein
MRTSMGFETTQPVVFPPLSPPTVADPWSWYSNVKGDDDDNNEIEEESE